MKKVLYFINCLVVVALLFSYISPFINPEHTWFFSFFGLGFPMLMVVNAVFLLTWLFLEPKYMWVSGIFLVLGVPAINRTIGFNKQPQNPKGIKVMSYNIGNSRFKLFKKENQPHIDKFRRMLVKQNPDIICVQERHPKLLEAYKQIFKGYRLYPDSLLGTAIYSRYPIVRSGNIPYHTNFHNSTWADIKINEEVVRVYNVHLSSNHVSRLTNNVKQIMDASWKILKKYNEHAQMRVGQLDQLIKHASASKYPVIICGDFNDVPQSYIYRQMSLQYKDAFLEVGNGLVQTLRSRFLGLRIDYLFATPDIPILAQEVIDTEISDHYPILTIVDIDNMMH